jgi:hypothetical protein
MGFAILATCLGILIRKKIKKHKNISVPSESNIINYRLISFHELVRATENFSESNLIGSGNFGKVFKGQLGYSMKKLSPEKLGISVVSCY